MKDWAGTDFHLDDDHRITNQGDYALASGGKNIDLALIRRLKTPLGSLFYDPTYGNPVYDMLGDPMNDDFVQKAQDGISRCVQGEQRVQLVRVEVYLANEDRTTRFRVVYRYRNGDGSNVVLQGVINDDGITI
ncbi:GPW/gp25 family protein [Paenibacillus naphthalenovorans]|uniref:GPW/gp25 family protein n=1 Tax=Paenibacillus naphthalenovorans TaxID=162209 RepID=UPI00088F1913|nr:GPW/gp25 family protein [Paenibacillus naphthalenovorans]SDI48938.1 hypothetical protein SAMN05421868_10716 [Paenibacillus naphthalenovorans]